MSQLNQWTPIQEGRFHLRNMKPGESVKEYCQRFRPTECTRKFILQVHKTLKLAKAELPKQVRRRTFGYAVTSVTFSGDKSRH
jgi:hypothetical protein